MPQFYKPDLGANPDDPFARDEKPYFAHPMFWAPFVVVGEGGVPAG